MKIRDFFHNISGPGREISVGADLSRIIEMAWEDRTPFEAIETQFGLNQERVTALMRAQLKASSFEMWRTRTKGRTTKHAKLRPVAMNSGTKHLAPNRLP